MMPDPESPRDAAVVVPVFRDPDGELCLVLLRRSEGGTHGGQLALPGGSRDPEDASLRDTAIRETCEEIGLTPEAIAVIEELPVIETRTTRFRIAPFLARIRPPGSWVVAEREVAEVIVVRVLDLLRPGVHGEEIETLPTGPEARPIPFYRIGPHRLWGATYRILHPILPRLAAGEWGV
jgi:8-oxo-dGTP pyrophosphatase MutT (NUDIX family)